MDLPERMREIGAVLRARQRRERGDLTREAPSALGDQNLDPQDVVASLNEEMQLDHFAFAHVRAHDEPDSNTNTSSNSVSERNCSTLSSRLADLGVSVSSLRRDGVLHGVRPPIAGDVYRIEDYLRIPPGIIPLATVLSEEAVSVLAIKEVLADE